MFNKHETFGCTTGRSHELRAGARIDQDSESDRSHISPRVRDHNVHAELSPHRPLHLHLHPLPPGSLSRDGHNHYVVHHSR